MVQTTDIRQFGCCSMVAALLALPSSLAAETLIVFSGAVDDTYVGSGSEGGLGNMILWESDLTSEDGTVIGSNAGTCIQVSDHGNHVCNFIVDHEGQGLRTFTGIQVPDPGVSRLTITGGTGAYEGAVGELRSQPVEDRKRFRFEIDYRLTGRVTLRHGAED